MNSRKSWVFVLLLAAIIIAPANFNAQTADVFYTVSVQTAGNGSGIVVSSPPGIDCGGELNNCTAQFVRGTPVTLRPRALHGPTQFAGWTVAMGSTIRCPASANDCNFILTENSSVHAGFIAD